MSNKEAKLYNFKLNFYAVSPLHIGTGDDIEPFSYVIQDGHLYYYDLTKLILMMSDSERTELLKRISNPGAAAIIPVRKYISEFFDSNKHREIILYDYKLKHNNVIKYYDERFSGIKKDKINSLAISTIYRNHLNDAIIPGSSIKGMVRNAFVKINNLENIEKYLKIQEDPFKFVRVSDGIRDKKTSVNIAFIHHILKDKLEVGGNTQTSLLEYITPNQSFTVEFSVDLSKDISSCNKEYTDKLYDDFTSGKLIINMLNKFYQPKFEKLYKIILKDGGKDHPFIKNVENIMEKCKGKPVAFVQLGKYGGQEMYGGEAQKKLKYRRYISYNQIERDSDLHVQNLMPLGWTAVL